MSNEEQPAAVIVCTVDTLVEIGPSVYRSSWRATRLDTFSDRQHGGMQPVRLTRRAFLAAGGGLLIAATAGGHPDIAFADNPQLEWAC